MEKNLVWQKILCDENALFAMAFQARQGGSANPHIPRNGPRAQHWHSYRRTKRRADLAGIIFWHALIIPPHPRTLKLFLCEHQSTQTHETIQYNLPRAHYALANHNPKPSQFRRGKEGFNPVDIILGSALAGTATNGRLMSAKRYPRSPLIWRAFVRSRAASTGERRGGD